MSGHSAILRDGNENKQPGERVSVLPCLLNKPFSAGEHSTAVNPRLTNPGNRRHAVINPVLGRITFQTVFFLKKQYSTPSKYREVDLYLIHQTEMNVIPRKRDQHFEIGGSKFIC